MDGRWSVLLVAGAVWFAPDVAAACSEGFRREYHRDPSSSDVTAPGPVGIRGVTVRRAVRPLTDDGFDTCRGGSSGRWAGSIGIAIEPSVDDAYRSSEIGYRMEYVAGKLPSRFEIPADPQIAGFGDALELRWDDRDDDEVIDFRVRLIPIDPAGNEGRRASPSGSTTTAWAAPPLELRHRGCSAWCRSCSAAGAVERGSLRSPAGIYGSCTNQVPS